jgi:LysR family nod box-dependent transcriptional activator
MRFKGLDLNLLLTLETLLQERSVSAAARRINMSQPAVSAMLARLRQWFGDPLFIQHGKSLVPSPYALRLHPMLTEVLAQVDALVSQPVLFNPMAVQRRFRICTSDYITSVVLHPLLQEISQIAPRIEIEITPPDDNALAQLDRGEIDLLIIPHEFVSHSHPARLLLEERHVVVGWDQNPLLQSPLSLDDFTAASHIAVRIGRVMRLTFAEAQLRAAGVARREDVVVPAFTLVPELLVGTHRLSVMHERLARKAAQRVPIALAPLPLDFPPMREMVQYHRARKDDAGLLWLLEQIDRIVQAVDAA